ncbi:hypothetical protein [Methylocystis rosea]|uniref:hypothetical protein n=1 Tax=Methylocystis rosea TaxID=173366 RepID=UPI001FD89812|nr:hypothetical protein [Methylocystis rosea]
MDDEFLVLFAEYVMSQLRPHDEFFRFGGENFFTALPTPTLNKDGRLRRSCAKAWQEGSLPSKAICP